MTIFNEQIARKPDLYPWTQKFIETAHNGFWTHREFNFQSDVQDFKVNLTEEERQMIVRALSTIGQLEISVKKFWAKLGDNLPHPSLYDLGYTFASQEVIHGDAYEALLEKLGLNQAFDDLLKEDIIKGRVNYLRKYLHKFHSDNKKQFIYSVILFTLFIENLALFSQFYLIGWFGRFKNVLKDTNKMTEYSTREECFVEGTEVLTPDGWRLISDMKIGDPIFQYTENQEIETTQVLHTTKKHYSGDVYSFSRKGNFCSVTPEHDMVYFNKHNQLIRKKAKDIKFDREVKVPKFGVWNQEGDNMLSFEERLMIAIQADGSNVFWGNKAVEKKLKGANGVFIYKTSISKKRKIERLDWILENSNIKYTKSEPDKNQIITYRIWLNHDADSKNLDWVNLTDKSAEWCASFLDEMKHWDGYISEENTIGYCSTNKSYIDKVQMIAILAGRITSLYTNTKKGHEDKTCYKLCISKQEDQPSSHFIKKTISKYEGNVYCVTVPSGVIITRLNGKTFIAGNCLHAQAGMQVVNTIRKEYPDLFDEELKEKIYRECREAVEYELKIIEWIVGKYSEEKISSEILKEFIKNRLNEGLIEIGYEKIFEVDKELLKKTRWFDEQLLGNNHGDFFVGKLTEYSKNSCYDENELF